MWRAIRGTDSIHDQDTMYPKGVGRTLEAMGLEVLKTPARVPQANTFWERVIDVLVLQLLLPNVTGCIAGSGSDGVARPHRDRAR